MVLVAFPDQQWLDDVGPIDGVESVVWDSDGDPPEGEVEIFIGRYMGGPETVAVIRDRPSVRLVQVLSAGYEAVLPVLPEGVALANAGGVHNASTAELAVGLILASQRGLADFVRAQDKGEWLPRSFRPSLADRRVLILGYGSIGRSLAQRLATFEVELTAVASTARDGDDLIERIHGFDELDELLPQQEIVVLLTPLTDSTNGLMDERHLALLPDDALVVNVSRGPVLSTEAALAEAGRLRFALDVTDPEPLPADHPLWHAPGVLISPHVGGVSTAFRPRGVALLREQLRRAASGDDPVNVVHSG